MGMWETLDEEQEYHKGPTRAFGPEHVYIYVVTSGKDLKGVQICPLIPFEIAFLVIIFMKIL